MGADKCNRAGNVADKQGVIGRVPPGEENYVPGLKLGKLRLTRNRPSGVICFQKIAKVARSAPGGGAVLQIIVVPAEGRRGVHDAAAGKEALGDKIGAVAAKL